MQVLLISLLLVTVGLRNVFCCGPGFHFTAATIRMCLKSEFLYYPDVTGGEEFLCALACTGRGSRCQGFWLPEGRCQTFEFDKCSHMVNVANCSQFIRAFVRKQENLPRGQLCPPGYGYNYLGSTYKIFDVTNWTDGLARCSSEAGLTKFTDAMDMAEAEHLHVIKNSSNPIKNIFVGGHRTAGIWKWETCNVTFLPEVWEPGQPNNQGDYTDIWYDHVYGIDDDDKTSFFISNGMCECVNPFV